jgi:tetratricopeptide (TPR) repeat protein
VPWRALILLAVCLVAVADTGAQSNSWRQCVADTTPAAIEACTLIISLDPKNDGAFINRGIAYRRIGDLERALLDYHEAIRLNPLAADAFNNRGNAYKELNQFDRAIQDYDEAIRLNPHYAHAYNNRGVIFLESGQPERAAADFDYAIGCDPAYANAFRNRGLARTEQRQFDRALNDFDAAFRLNPEIGHGAEYALALYGRGLERQRDGDAGGNADIDEARRLLPEVADVTADEDIK